jgi:hypothetical protein
MPPVDVRGTFGVIDGLAGDCGKADALLLATVGGGDTARDADGNKRYVVASGSLISLTEGGLMTVGARSGRPVLSGTLTFIALAAAVTKAVALEKRAAGSRARLRMMTAVSAGRMWGLIRAGEIGAL